MVTTVVSGGAWTVQLPAALTPGAQRIAATRDQLGDVVRIQRDDQVGLFLLVPELLRAVLLAVVAVGGKLRARPLVGFLPDVPAADA